MTKLFMKSEGLFVLVDSPCYALGFAYVGGLKNKQIWLIYLLIQNQRPVVYVYIRTV